jgi:hypothetical protein
LRPEERLSPAEFLAALGRKAGSWSHERVAQGVLDTAPIVGADDGVILFSMIGTAVLLPYLVAVKSLHFHLRRGRVMLLNDGTLTAKDRAILAHHCGDPVILEKPDINTGHCPKDNCWERLLAILDRRSDAYVIQLDSDTVTTGPIPDIATAIDANRSFTLAGGVQEAATGFRSAREIASIFHAHGPNNDHVQSKAEAAMADMPDAEHARYIRGCAGFAGFARSSSGRALVSDFSTVMDERLGDAWRQWGSEQVASNFVIANDSDPLQLPYDRYVNHWKEPLPDDPAFVHFIGTYRFRHGNYSRCTRDAIARLRA